MDKTEAVEAVGDFPCPIEHVMSKFFAFGRSNAVLIASRGAR